MDEVTKAIQDALGLEDATEDKETDVDTTVDTDVDKDVKVDEPEKAVEDDVEKKEDKKVLPDDDKEKSVTGFDTQLLEISGGKFKNYTDIETALNGASQDAFANETVAKLNEYVKNGGDVDVFMKTQTMDYSEMGDSEAIKEVMMLNETGLSREEIDLLVEDEYGISEDSSDSVKRLAGIKMKKAASEAKKTLAEHQEKWSVPQVSNSERELLVQQENDAWKGNLSQVVDNVKEMEITVGDETFKHEISDEERTLVKSQYDLSKFWSRYKNEDGSENVQKLVKDMIILNNFDKIVSNVAKFAQGQGTQEIIDGIKNSDFKGKDDKTDGKPKQIADQIGEQMFV